MTANRSGCPINMSLELIGDRWSLIVLRDIIFGDKRHFTDLLRRSEEKITPKILTDRLERLEREGILTRSPDPTHKQRSIISLTAKGIDLLPVLIALSNWGTAHLDVAPRFAERARAIEAGGDGFLRALMAELRREHLGEGGDAPEGSARTRLRQVAPPAG
ncbi:helix-turn-helix transcriptional regulator [Paracoccus caeni]|uniref:Helix-turn-helix transcriptional regulator n=1 Tax=Paracoccus caeni TaxID=657651 RepID=A0A934SI72_9RHOB|nr:helix-turn-helix domain-containing protein [Paracoccus caeni]MBK4215629.1 helix-turn-helix transcriptional regulator [Paracoccus caeni]